MFCELTVCSVTAFAEVSDLITVNSSPVGDERSGQAVKQLGKVSVCAPPDAFAITFLLAFVSVNVDAVLSTVLSAIPPFDRIVPWYVTLKNGFSPEKCP